MYSNDLICDILTFINDNINQKITIDDLKNKYFYNRYYIMKLFKKEIKITIIEYINSLRIYNCIKDLRDTNYSLNNIALRNGFYSLEYFAETFKKITNITPAVFRDYYKNPYQIDIDLLETINDSLIRLVEISNIKETYLSKKKPANKPVKSLSIFN